MSTQFLHKTYSKLFILSMIMMILSGYCAYHLVQGERSFLELNSLQAHEAHLDKEIATLEEKREALESRVQRMRSASVDVDMLEEQAMFFLGPRNDRQVQMH